MGRKRKERADEECPKQEEEESNKNVKEEDHDEEEEEEEDGLVVVDDMPEGSLAQDNNEDEHDRLDREYFNRMPPGIRFAPTEQELINEYLNKKKSNLPLPLNRIRDVNVYAYDPPQLAGMYKVHRQKEWYFFSPRAKKYPKGKRPDRATPNGFWKASGADKDITDEVDTKLVIGAKKSLVYYEGKHKDIKSIKKTDWIMKEFTSEHVGRVVERKAGDMTLDEWVLCMIYNKTDKGEEPYSNQQYEDAIKCLEPNNEQLTNQNPSGVNSESEDSSFLQNEQSPNVPDTSTKTPPYVACSSNMANNPVQQNKQMQNGPNPRTKTPTYVTDFSKLVNQPVQQNQKMQNRSANSNQYGAGFKNMASFPMQNEQMRYTYTGQGSGLCGWGNEFLNYDNVTSTNPFQTMLFNGQYPSIPNQNLNGVGQTMHFHGQYPSFPNQNANGVGIHNVGSYNMRQTWNSDRWGNGLVSNEQEDLYLNAVQAVQVSGQYPSYSPMGMFNNSTNPLNPLMYSNNALQEQFIHVAPLDSKDKEQLDSKDVSQGSRHQTAGQPRQGTSNGV